MVTIGYISNFKDNLKGLLNELDKTYNVETFYKDEANFKNIVDKLPPESIILWRMLETKEIKTKSLAERLTAEGYILINLYSATKKANDKLETFNILSEAKIPTIPTWECAAGVSIPENHIVKPRFGMKGENILFGKITREKIFEPVSAKALAPENYDWIMQPYVPESNKWLRVLIVNGEAIVAYRRIPPQGRNVANVNQGAKKEYIKLEDSITKIAVKTATTLGLTVAGIDMTHEPYLVVEANSVPSVPDEAVERFSKEVKKYLSQIINS
jgi:gamma-F420-2:alpha-L-glutamate ligase